MSKRSKRMPKLMTLRVGCAELLQAARSHPGCGPPLTNPPRIICVIPPKVGESLLRSAPSDRVSFPDGTLLASSFGVSGKQVELTHCW